MESVRVLTLAAQEGWQVHHMDVKSTFLNGDLKKDELGAVIKHKARLVARGFVQQKGIDYDDAFAPWCAWSQSMSSSH